MRFNILNNPVDCLDADSAYQGIIQMARLRSSGFVCFFNVHMAVTSLRNSALFRSIRAAKYVLPDGAPIAWIISRSCGSKQPRLSGPDMMRKILENAAEENLVVSFYGGSDNVLKVIENKIRNENPLIKIGCLISPPFRQPTPEELRFNINSINQAGTNILFVGLGCPKQEILMLNMMSELQCVLLGIGAALDFEAGTVPRAPAFFRNHGFEWLYRLVKEPRRLWRRYFFTNVEFLIRTSLRGFRASTFLDEPL